MVLLEGGGSLFSFFLFFSRGVRVSLLVCRLRVACGFCCFDLVNIDGGGGIELKNRPVGRDFDNL